MLMHEGAMPLAGMETSMHEYQIPEFQPSLPNRFLTLELIGYLFYKPEMGGLRSHFPVILNEIRKL